MFITNSSLSQWVPEAIGPGNQYWRAVILATEAPLYLLRHRVSCEDGSFVQSIGVSVEPTLLDIVGQLGPNGVLSLCMLSVCKGRWVLREISELWMAAADEAEETGSLLLQLKDESFLRDRDEREVGARKGRRLLFRTHGERVEEDTSDAA